MGFLSSRTWQHVLAIFLVGIAPQSILASSHFDDAVWRIQRGGSTGTAFLINSSGIFITAHHVVEQNADIFLFSPNNKSVGAQIVGTGLCTRFAATNKDGLSAESICLEGIDVAIVAAAPDATRFGKGLELQLIARPDRFRGVVYGFPQNNAGKRPDALPGIWADFGRYFEAQAPMFCGFSGGPLVNMTDARVAGVQSWATFYPPTCNYVGQRAYGEPLQVRQLIERLLELELDDSAAAALQRLIELRNAGSFDVQARKILDALDDLRFLQVTEHFSSDSTDQSVLSVIEMASRARNVAQ